MEITELLKRREEFKQSKSYSIMYNEEELDFILNHIITLNKKESMTAICAKYSIGRTMLRKLLKDTKNYIPINKQNLLRVRKDLFETISTEEDAYWLGFIYADGYISKEGSFEISLNYNDYNHLLKFADYCNFDRSKVVEKQEIGEHFRCRLSFATQGLKSNFFKVGIIPNKSLVLTYPNFLPESLQRHFIRGYFDGDGCINLRKPRTLNNTKREVTASILGTEEFLSKLNEKVKLPLKSILKTDNIYRLVFSCKDARKFLKTIYNNSNIHLDRKYNKYQNEIAPLFSNE